MSAFANEKPGFSAEKSAFRLEKSAFRREKVPAAHPYFLFLQGSEYLCELKKIIVE
jgi:hypothetical protein